MRSTPVSGWLVGALLIVPLGAASAPAGAGEPPAGAPQPDPRRAGESSCSSVVLSLPAVSLGHEDTAMIVQPYPFVRGVTITGDLSGNVALVGQEQEEIGCDEPTQRPRRRFTGIAKDLFGFDPHSNTAWGPSEAETKKKAEDDAKGKAEAWARAGSFLCVEPHRGTPPEVCADQAAIKVVEGPVVVGETTCTPSEGPYFHSRWRLCTAQARIRIKVKCPCI